MRFILCILPPAFCIMGESCAVGTQSDRLGIGISAGVDRGSERGTPRAIQPVRWVSSRNKSLTVQNKLKQLVLQQMLCFSQNTSSYEYKLIYRKFCNFLISLKYYHVLTVGFTTSIIKHHCTMTTQKSISGTSTTDVECKRNPKSYVKSSVEATHLTALENVFGVPQEQFQRWPGVIAYCRFLESCF